MAHLASRLAPIASRPSLSLGFECGVVDETGAFLGQRGTRISPNSSVLVLIGSHIDVRVILAAIWDVLAKEVCRT